MDKNVQVTNPNQQEQPQNINGFQSQNEEECKTRVSMRKQVGWPSEQKHDRKSMHL